MKAIRSAGSSSPAASTIGLTLPVAESVYCRSSPFSTSSVHTLKISPSRATSGSIGWLGSTAVDENTTVRSSMNCAPPSSWVPNVNWVCSPVATSSLNSLLLPPTRLRCRMLLPSGA